MSYFPQHLRVAKGHGPEQAAPGKMHVYFVGYSVELNGQVFDRSLKKEKIRQSALSRLSMNLLGYLLQWTSVGIHSYEELLRMLSRALVYKETVSSPQVYHYPFACKGR